MLKIKLHAFVLALVSLVLAVLIVIGWQVPSHTVEFNPPDRGAPGRLIGAGTRFSEDPDLTRSTSDRRQIPITIDGEKLECPLTALVPQGQFGNYGLTIDTYPTFFIHIPPLPGARIEFLLQDDDENSIYETSYMTTGADGTFELALPRYSNFPPLKLDRTYTWSVTIKPDPTHSSSNYVVRGQIERFNATQMFAKELEDATPQQRVALYAGASLWYDAVKTLAELRRADPDNLQLLEEWVELLKSVGLDDIATKPLI